MLKRQMYGRGGPDLLRRHILLADNPPQNTARKVCQNQFSGSGDTPLLSASPAFGMHGDSTGYALSMAPRSAC